VTMADPPAHAVVLRFGGRPVPRALAGLPVVEAQGPAEIDAATATARRVIVVGAEPDLAAVLTRLLRTDRLGVEVAHVRRRGAARRARTVRAQRVPLIRDETAQVLVGTAYWLPADGARTMLGEGVVDDTVLFDGAATGVRIEPIPTMPGLRASVLTGRLRPNRWVTGRAAQLGTTGALVVRDGVTAPRPVRRSTFYRHTEGWLRVP
jgi:hypothetical protein